MRFLALKFMSAMLTYFDLCYKNGAEDERIVPKSPFLSAAVFDGPDRSVSAHSYRVLPWDVKCGIGAKKYAITTGMAKEEHGCSIL